MKNKEMNFKNLMRNALYAMLAAVLFSCQADGAKEETTFFIKEKTQLILETEHCKYYCLARNGYDNCKMVVCECDAGYSCDASVSW